MELLQLRYFFESAQTQSFTKTAEKYMVPLTSVSASVKRLEKELGYTLFDRHSNKITLNENGKKLQNSLFMIFGELDNIIGGLQDEHKEIKIAVRVLRNEITDHIINYTSQNPKISFKTIFDFEDTNMDDFDIIIDDEGEKYPDHKMFEYATRPMRFRVSAKSELCDKKLMLKDLWNQNFITMGENTSAHKMLVNACHREGFHPNIAVQTNDLLCYNKYIEAGIGIALGRYEPEVNRNKGTRFIDVQDFSGRQTIYVFYKSKPHVREFVNYIKEKASQ